MAITTMLKLGLVGAGWVELWRHTLLLIAKTQCQVRLVITCEIETLPVCPHGRPHGGLPPCARGAGAQTNCMPGTDMRGHDVISIDRVQQTSSREQCQAICQNNP